MRIKKKEILKECSKCHDEKLLSEFHKDDRGVHGVRSDCKSCRKQSKPRSEWKPNRTDIKVCEKCNVKFTPKSNRQKWCENCGEVENYNSRLKAMHEYYKRTYVKKGYSHLVGENANAYKNGIGLYAKKLAHIDSCERCGSKKHLLVHHRDRRRENNDMENLERLCKKCHQEEHLIRDETGRYIGSV